MNAKTMAALALAAAVVGCGGKSDDATVEELSAVAPDLDQVALSIDDSDEQPASLLVAGGGDEEQALAAAPECRPNLFSRAREVALRINRHAWKQLRYGREALAAAPKLTEDGQSAEWVRTGPAGIGRKLVVTRVAAGSYTWELSLAADPANPSWVKVANGTATRTTDTTATVKVSTTAATFDFDAFAQVLPREKASGKITVTASRTLDGSKPAPGLKRTATVQLDGFQPDDGDPRGPRTATYTWLREPNLGGLMTFSDSLILNCPSNPQSKAAEVTAVARWFKADDGIWGRTDAKATGGQIPADATWVGLSCHKGASATTRLNERGYWMLKLVDATGATVRGSAKENGPGEPACAAEFGPVPQLESNANDYDFTKPASFPGQW